MRQSGTYPLITGRQKRVQLSGRPLHENSNRVAEKRENAERDQSGDEHGTDGVSDHPTEVRHEYRRYDDTNAAECVGQNVKKHSLHDLPVTRVTIGTARVTVIGMRVTAALMAMAVM